MSPARDDNPRVVFDTNVYVSAIVFGGTPEILFDMARSNEIKLLVSRPILLEVSRILFRKLKIERHTVLEAVSEIRRISELIVPKKRLHQIKEDEPDNRILECALEGHADAIITGDKKHIRVLGQFEGIPIYLPAEYIKQNRSR